MLMRDRLQCRSELIFFLTVQDDRDGEGRRGNVSPRDSQAFYDEMGMSSTNCRRNIIPRLNAEPSYPNDR